MTTINPVTSSPARPQTKRCEPNTGVPLAVPMVPQPTVREVAAARPAIDKIPAAIRPLYSAPMIELLEPSFTKYVPAMDVTMQAGTYFEARLQQFDHGG